MDLAKDFDFEKHKNDKIKLLREISSIEQNRRKEEKEKNPEAKKRNSRKKQKKESLVKDEADLEWKSQIIKHTIIRHLN